MNNVFYVSCSLLYCLLLNESNALNFFFFSIWLPVVHSFSDHCRVYNMHPWFIILLSPPHSARGLTLSTPSCRYCHLAFNSTYIKFYNIITITIILFSQNWFLLVQIFTFPCAHLFLHLHHYNFNHYPSAWKTLLKFLVHVVDDKFV